MPRFNVHAGAVGDEVLGSDVERSIDIRIGPQLRLYDPALRPGPASCPDWLDLSGGKVGHCTLPIGGLAFPIIVTPGAGPGTFFVRMDGTLVNMSQAETALAGSVFSRYGIRAVVTCGSPRVRRFTAGQHRTCTLRGRGLPHTIQFKTEAGGSRFTMFSLPHVKPLAVMRIGPYLTLHDEGRPVILSGATLDEIVRRSITPKRPPDPSSPRWSVRCPDRADLSKNRHATCVVTTSRGTMLYDAWIAGGTFHVLIRRGLSDSESIRVTAEHFYEYQLAAIGRARRVSVDCGPKRMIPIDRSTKLLCTIDAGDGVRPLTITYPDFPSHVRYLVGAVRSPGLRG